jgi:hypothetical protein
MKKIDKYICISYTPQIFGEPGKLIEDPKSIMEMAKRLDKVDANATGCAWAEHNGLISPIFIIENAKQVYEHLMIWCENKPEEWFSLTIKKHKDGKRYWVILWPDINKSVERFKLGHLIYNENIITNEEITVLCKPWRFVSKDEGTYESLKSKVGDKSYFGFVDVNDMQKYIGKKNIQIDIEPDWIGLINVKDNNVESLISE